MADGKKTRGAKSHYLTANFGFGHIGIMYTWGIDANFLAAKDIRIMIPPKTTDGEGKQLDADDDRLSVLKNNRTGKVEGGNPVTQGDDVIGGIKAVKIKNPFGRGGEDVQLRAYLPKCRVLVRLYLVQGTQVWQPTKPLSKIAPNEKIEWNWYPRKVISFYLPSVLQNEAGEKLRPGKAKEGGKPGIGKGITYPILIDYINSSQKLIDVVAGIQIERQLPRWIRPKMILPTPRSLGGKAPAASASSLLASLASFPSAKMSDPYLWYDDSIRELPETLPHGFAGLSLYEMYGWREDFNERYGLLQNQIDQMTGTVSDSEPLSENELDYESEIDIEATPVNEPEPTLELPIGHGFDPYATPNRQRKS